VKQDDLAGVVLRPTRVGLMLFHGAGKILCRVDGLAAF